MRVARFLLCVLVAGACSGEGGDGGVEPASGPCAQGAPGIEVHVAVTCTALSPCGFLLPEVRINYPGKGLVAYDVSDGVHLDAFDDQRRATFRLEVPAGAGAGPAVAAFYADAAGAYHVHGEVSFTADPFACVGIDLPAADIQD
jgi:hypothetical protein